MRLCFHPCLQVRFELSMEFGPVHVVSCPDCLAVAYGLYCVPSLPTPCVIEEEHEPEP